MTRRPFILYSDKVPLKRVASGMWYRLENYGPFRIWVGPFPTYDTALNPQK